MTSVDVTSTPVQNVTTISTASGLVGYMLFNDHVATAEEQLIDAVSQLSTAGITDLVLDIRLDSPTFGNIVAHDMPVSPATEYSEWIWVPPGFAHGNLFTEETIIEYFCTGEYSPGNEAAVSPLASDLDWSLCAPSLRDEFHARVAEGAIISEKDRDAASLSSWKGDPRSANFRYSELAGTGS
jgi:hypothetical protein